MKPDISKLTTSSARKHLDARDFSAVDLAQASLDVIKAKDGEIHAFLEVFDDVLDQAARADAMIKEGTTTPLTGIPIAIKDNILIKGKRVSAASKILEGYVASYDSTVVDKLKRAGAIIMGRTNMDEFAMGVSTEGSAFGMTKNPLDTSRVPGGTSGGSAAAVAMGAVCAGIGSDTGGSLRQPSAFCGVVGLKPTYGSVSRHGLIAHGSSLDVIGPLARNVSDAEIVFTMIAGKDPMDSTSVAMNDHGLTPPKAKTIGIPRKFLMENKLRPEVAEVFERALERLRELGYVLIDIELPHISYAVPAYYIIVPAEASANLARFDGMRFGLHEDGEDLIGDYFKSRGKGFGPEPRRRIMVGTYVLSSGYYDAYYNRANAIRRAITRDFINALEHCEVIAMPTTIGPAFKIGEKIDDPVQMYLDDIFTGAINLTGLPAMSVPSGTVREGGIDLPLGLELITSHMGERLIFEVGKKFLGETQE